MVDKITSVRRERIRERIGKVSPLKLTQIGESVLRFLGFESR
jgi:mRNA-degrading endonuclease toxin of MazEF toxin-antitoxin module